MLFGAYFLINQLVTQETRHIIKAPQKAGQNPATVKPLTIVLVNQNKKALIKSVNKPKVSKLMGKVSKTSNGLIKALIIPKTKAAIKAA